MSPLNSGSLVPGGGTGGGGGGSGTVTSVSGVNANGFTWSIATPTTTPALTLSYTAPSVPTAYTLSTVTADPAPAVVGTYYRTNYAGNGNFTLPTSPATGSWILVKQVANNTLSIVGTVDGNASFTMTQYQSYLFIYNGTNWDVN